MDLTIRMIKVNNVKHRYIVYLKSGDRFFTSLTLPGLESTDSTSSTIQGNLLLYYRKFPAFVISVTINIF